jgi:hypothetical protein
MTPNPIYGEGNFQDVTVVPHGRGVLIDAKEKTIFFGKFLEGKRNGSGWEIPINNRFKITIM